jgi:hypothetical protein
MVGLFRGLSHLLSRIRDHRNAVLPNTAKAGILRVVHARSEISDLAIRTLVLDLRSWKKKIEAE